MTFCIDSNVRCYFFYTKQIRQADFSIFSKLIFTIFVQLYFHMLCWAREYTNVQVSTLLLWRLCHSNASVSVESRSNILLSQLQFLLSLFPFSFPKPVHQRAPVEFPEDWATYIPLQVFYMFHIRWKKYAVKNQISTCCLCKCCLGDEVLLNVSYENNNLHSVHSLCHWILIFLDVWVSHV